MLTKPHGSNCTTNNKPTTKLQRNWSTLPKQLRARRPGVNAIVVMLQPVDTCNTRLRCTIRLFIGIEVAIERGREPKPLQFVLLTQGQIRCGRRRFRYLGYWRRCWRRFRYLGCWGRYWRRFRYLGYWRWRWRRFRYLGYCGALVQQSSKVDGTSIEWQLPGRRRIDIGIRRIVWQECHVVVGGQQQHVVCTLSFEIQALQLGCITLEFVGTELIANLVACIGTTNLHPSNKSMQPSTSHSLIERTYSRGWVTGRYSSH
jgi:hypothetical protein